MSENLSQTGANNPIPEGKMSFEVKVYSDGKGGLKQGVFIGGELLDWSIDVGDLVEAKKMGPQYWKSLQIDIVRHFVQAASEFVGRKLSVEELNEARQNGYI